MAGEESGLSTGKSTGSNANLLLLTCCSQAHPHQLLHECYSLRRH